MQCTIFSSILTHYLFSDSDHFCRRFLRAGGCDVTEAIKVLHSYLSVYHLCPHYYEDLLPLGKNEKAYKALINMTLPHRYLLLVTITNTTCTSWFQRQIWPESIHLESWKVGPQQDSLRDDLLCRLQHDGANFTWAQDTGSWCHNDYGCQQLRLQTFHSYINDRYEDELQVNGSKRTQQIFTLNNLNLMLLICRMDFHCGFVSCMY